MSRLLIDLGALGLGILVLLVGTAILQGVRGSELERLQERNTMLAEEIANLQGIIDEVRVARALKEELEVKLFAIEALRPAGRETPNALAAIEASLPSAAHLTSLSFAEGQLELVGVGDNADVADLVEGLQASGCFADVAMKAEGEGFSVTATVSAERCPEAIPGLRDLFEPAVATERSERRAHPLVRWPARSYTVVACEPGKQAIVRDPDGGSHLVSEGSVLGSERALVTHITDDLVILTHDEVVDVETKETVSHIVTLRLDAE